MGIFDFLFGKPAAPTPPVIATPVSGASATDIAAMTATAAAAVAASVVSTPSGPWTLTADMLTHICGRSDDSFPTIAASFNKAIAGTLINGKVCALTSANEAMMFLAQSLEETEGFTSMVENLYYSHADRIAAVWPTRFSYNGVGHGPLNSADYVGNPKLLANCVYANRGGNGNTASGDGYNFRGRGSGFNLTFRNNYSAASQALYGDDRLVKNPDQVATDFNIGFATGMWFWFTDGLGALVQAKGLYGSLNDVTLRVNGSTDSVPARKAWLDKITQL